MLEIILFDILEVAVSTYLQFIAGNLITNDDAMLVLLQSADGPSLGNRAFDGSLQGAGLVMTVAENHYLSGSHHGTHTYGQSQTRYLLRIIIEETGVGNLGICSERLYSCAGG